MWPKIDSEGLLGYSLIFCQPEKSPTLPFLFLNDDFVSNFNKKGHSF